MSYLAKFRFPHKEMCSIRRWKKDKVLILSLHSSNIVTACLRGIEFCNLSNLIYSKLGYIYFLCSIKRFSKPFCLYN